jgi:hypothetical protein
VDADLDTLVTALCVKIDDMLAKDRRPGHPARLSQPELVCLAVAQALLGFQSEHRWIRLALCHLRGAFPYLPHQPGYNKRLRAALPLIKQVIRALAAMLDVEPHLAVARPGLTLITDKGFADRVTEADLASRGITLLRPSRKDETARCGEPLLKTTRQLIESVNDTLKGQLDLEAHGGRTIEGVAIRIAQRILAMGITRLGVPGLRRVP